MAKQRDNEWTDQQAEALLKRVSEGLSASQIEKRYGSEIGHRSRSSICGKLHRMRLAGKLEKRRCGRRKRFRVQETFKGKSLMPEECFLPEGIDDALDELASLE